jgi:hypothetical protein
VNKKLIWFFHSFSAKPFPKKILNFFVPSSQKSQLQPVRSSKIQQEREKLGMSEVELLIEIEIKLMIEIELRLSCELTEGMEFRRESSFEQRARRFS